MKKIYVFFTCLIFGFFFSLAALADEEGGGVENNGLPTAEIPLTPAVPSTLPLQPQTDSVSKSVAGVSQKIDQMSFNLDQLSQQLKLLDHPKSQPRWLEGLNANLLTLISLFLSLITICLLIIVLVRQSKIKKQLSLKLSVQAAEPGPAQGEYDFMGSSEGVAAKLDLVRAYIAMGETTAAKEAISQVLRLGNTEQRQEAKSLLNAI